MIARGRSAPTWGAIRDRVVSSNDRGPRIRQYCFGIGARAINWVRLRSRVPSPPARTSPQRDPLVGSVMPVWRCGLVAMLLMDALLLPSWSHTAWRGSHEEASFSLTA